MKRIDESKYLFLPYIQGLSSQSNKLFSKHNITECYKGYNLLSKYFNKLKSKHKTRNMVVKMNCLQWLWVRIHKYNYKNAFIELGKKNDLTGLIAQKFWTKTPTCILKKKNVLSDLEKKKRMC